MNHDYALTNSPLLRLENLCITFATESGPLPAVHDLNLVLRNGETLCLVGESGCGKSLTAKAIMRLTPEKALLRGRVWLHDVDLLALREKDMQTVRGKKIGMVFQEPMTSLNPVLRIGEQVAEPLRMHLGLSKKEAKKAAVALLAEVDIPAPAERYDDYPHQLSGGMRQRVMLAIALSCRPALLIADEPTTALDTTVQEQILRLLTVRSQELGMAVLLITHDLGIARQMADSVGVMYAGRLVEFAQAEALFSAPMHPYTQGLLHSVPTLQSMQLDRLPTIPGSVPSLQAMPSGCPFHTRCAHALPRCAEDMPPLGASGGHKVACWQAVEKPQTP
ncbi:MAG: ABC transporter ATP-binding protein [Desulfovibrio sp.]|nr:ABC transporter ATP-binding protein [Desulfovibrio sp.]